MTVVSAPRAAGGIRTAGRTPDIRSRIHVRTLSATLSNTLHASIWAFFPVDGVARCGNDQRDCAGIPLDRRSCTEGAGLVACAVTQKAPSHTDRLRSLSPH